MWTVKLTIRTKTGKMLSQTLLKDKESYDKYVPYKYPASTNREAWIELYYDGDLVDVVLVG